jgi:hypothetical protein
MERPPGRPATIQLIIFLLKGQSQNIYGLLSSANLYLYYTYVTFYFAVTETLIKNLLLASVKLLLMKWLTETLFTIFSSVIGQY